ncbi:MAG: hypothetical protein ACI9XZ_000390 [Alphaproteobacteria bacterium]
MALAKSPLCAVQVLRYRERVADWLANVFDSISLKACGNRG